MSTTEVMEAGEAPTRGKKKLLLIVVPLVLLLAAGAAAWFVFFAPDVEALEDEPLVEGQIVVMEPQTTTLGDSQLHHARVAVAVVLAEGIDPEVVPMRAALLQDALLRELATMTAAEVRSAEGSDVLRQRLSAEAREIWEEDEVVRVVLTELLVS